MLTIGHRGARGYIAENTLESIQKALDLNVDGIEIDVLRCASGEIVVFHDKKLKRLTGHNGLIEETTFEELKNILVAGRYRIPTLQQVLEKIDGKILLNVELKGSATASSVADFIAANKGDRINYLVSSFDHTELAHFRHCDANTPVAPLFGRWRSDWLQTASALRASTVNLSHRITTARRVTEIRDAGFDVWVYTVNTTGRAAHLAAMGVAGVFTDRPDRLLPKQIEVGENL